MSGEETNASSFGELGLCDWIIKSCEKMGMKKPTPVQSHCIPHILRGEDVHGSAQTGSGKTAAFALPILHKLSEDPFGIFALVLTPTRELAFQIADQFRAIGAPMKLRDAVIVGGVGLHEQVTALQKHPHVVIATPGRLAEHIRTGTEFSLKRIKYLVMDEADRLFESGYAPDLSVIMSALNPDRQTLLFSATMTKNLEKIEELAPKKPFKYAATPTMRTVETLTEQYVFIPERVKECYLHHILSSRDGRSAMVFLATVRSCEIVYQALQELKFPCVRLHSLMAQKDRLKALNVFRSGEVKTLLATDVASRGLDIPTVDLVVNYDLPKDPRDYIHRVGRTARAGRTGQSVAVVSQFDIDLVHKIEEVTNVKMTEYKVNETEALEKMNKVSAAVKTAMAKLEDGPFAEKAKRREEQKPTKRKDRDGESSTGRPAKRPKKFKPKKSAKKSEAAAEPVEQEGGDD